MKPQERVNAILKSRLEPSARLLLVSIASHMSDGALLTWISPDTMTEETGLSRSTVMSLLASLTAAGVLTRTDEGHRAKTTRILWDALAAYEPAATKRGGTRVQSDNRTVESEDRTVGSDYRTPENDCTNPVQGSEHRTEGSGYRTEESEHRTPNRPIIGPDPTMNRPVDPTMNRPAEPAHETHPAQPSPQPTPEPEPMAAPRPQRPLFACWIEQPKPAVVEEPEEEEDPLPADHLLLLTTRPDGSPAEPLAVASRLAGKLISVGIATPADLELATTDDVAKAVGKPGMQAIDRALRAWGTKLLLPTRAMVEDIRARARARSGKPDLSPVEEALLKAARIKLSEVCDANDFACHILSQRIDAARSTL